MRVRLWTAVLALGTVAIGLALTSHSTAFSRAILLFTFVYVVNGLIEFLHYFYRGLARSDVESTLTLVATIRDADPCDRRVVVEARCDGPRRGNGDSLARMFWYSAASPHASPRPNLRTLRTLRTGSEPFEPFEPFRTFEPRVTRSAA